MERTKEPLPTVQCPKNQPLRSGGLMICTGITLDHRIPLHVFERGTVTASSSGRQISGKRGYSPENEASQISKPQPCRTFLGRPWEGNCHFQHPSENHSRPKNSVADQGDQLPQELGNSLISGGVETKGSERCHLHEDQAQDALDRPVVEKTATSFNLSSDDNRVRVWRPPGERLNLAFALQRHTGLASGVMVWCAIAYNIRSPLVLIHLTLTAQRYVHDMLQPHVLPLMQWLLGAIFQQGNARRQGCHKTVSTLPWPARSSYLSPIEQIWDHLGRNESIVQYCWQSREYTGSRRSAFGWPQGTTEKEDRRVWRMFSLLGLAIHQNDHQARRRFVEWAQNEIAVVPDFHKRILFSDEAHFWLNGYVNKQNCRIWSEANPQVYVETPLHPEKLTVWCALWAGGILLQKR
ncbi:transposable element Tcb2 transposase [Trichonephila clavipes]|nr:transposable element Tcb2 transposase [Trichonephila clavipes]